MARAAAVYVRQSRTRGLTYSSCQNQADLCQSLALQRGWTVTTVYSDEGQSSETLDRPELSRLLDAIKTGQVERLIVYSADRLSRRLIDFLRLLELFDEHNVELTVVNDPNYSDTAVGRLMTNIVAAASEFQQDLTRDRMADMRAAYKRHGKRVAGRVPFGYQADPVTKQLVVDPEQFVVVRDFFELASKGGRPSDLASLANLSEWRDHNGETGRWTARRILKLLKNRVYVGEILNGDSTLPGEHEAIVTVSTFDAVQDQLIRRRTRESNHGERQLSGTRSFANLLGKLFCGQCNRPMSTSVSHRGPIRYLYYRCRAHAGGRPPCTGVNISVYELEQYVGSVLANVEDADSELPREFRKHWNQLDERQRQLGLAQVIHRVVYDHEPGEITIEMKEIDVESFAAGGAEPTDGSQI
ncbi:hypothetical protein CA13_20130 [Planctomycetes bacterium CA13]|uniref:DNA-invertase hin n=2 Tax=Novipirellula herctigrandis TaxID=2527986 RepID=A0A5C5YZN3_9BACT|nr:hypothetical protein CA13_20130 [Planctomycetes bacterium CA13]